jgi:hypothetical protein
MEIAVVKVKEKAPQPLWLKHDGKEQFYKRRFASTVELVGEEMHRYIKEHWD